MKIIEIPSVASEKCSTTLKFLKENKDEAAWDVELECATPSFHAKIPGAINKENFKRFLSDLKDVEKTRKGECQIFDEWGFAITICSMDSLGHFMVKIAIWSQGKWHQSNGDDNLKDTMNISYEIEPSLVTTLLNQFNKLDDKLQK